MGAQPEGEHRAQRRNVRWSEQFKEMSKHLTGEPKAFTGNQPRRWRVERCHGCNRLVYACRSELDKNGKHYHRECLPGKAVSDIIAACAKLKQYGEEPGVLYMSVEYYSKFVKDVKAGKAKTKCTHGVSMDKKCAKCSGWLHAHLTKPKGNPRAGNA